MIRPKFKLIKYLLILTSVFIFVFVLILALGRIDESVEVWGEVSFQNHDPVYSPIDGFVDSICIKEGQAVKENQLLAMIRMREKPENAEILCPRNGFIFSSDLDQQRGRYVRKGEVLMVISDSYQMGFRVLIPEKRIPYIKKGLKATLFINAFPYQRFGTFQGVVTSTSPIPESKRGEVFYPATLLIKKTYVESETLHQGQRVFLRPGMRGRARIITLSNISILKKLINRFLS